MPTPENLEFDIHRVNKHQYHINGVVLRYQSLYETRTEGTAVFHRDHGPVWTCHPFSADPHSRPLFHAETLEEILDLVEGGMRLMAPRGD